MINKERKVMPVTRKLKKNKQCFTKRRLDIRPMNRWTTITTGQLVCSKNRSRDAYGYDSTTLYPWVNFKRLIWVPMTHRSAASDRHGYAWPMGQLQAIYMGSHGPWVSSKRSIWEAMTQGSTACDWYGSPLPMGLLQAIGMSTHYPWFSEIRRPAQHW